MCFRYAVLNNLKLFAISVRKWSRHLTEFPIVRFVTNNWQAMCRCILKDIYSHLCLNDVTVRRALVDSGPKPFVLHCQTQQGGLDDMVNDVLIETRVEMVAGRLSRTDWLQPTTTRGGLRNARRWLEVALVPGCLSGSTWLGLSFASRPPESVPIFLPFEFADISGVILSSSLLLMVTLFSTWTFPDYRHTESLTDLCYNQKAFYKTCDLSIY